MTFYPFEKGHLCSSNPLWNYKGGFSWHAHYIDLGVCTWNPFCNFSLPVPSSFLGWLSWFTWGFPPLFVLMILLLEELLHHLSAVYTHSVTERTPQRLLYCDCFSVLASVCSFCITTVWLTVSPLLFSHHNHSCPNNTRAIPLSFPAPKRHHFFLS